MTNLIYRASSTPTTPGTTSIKGAGLTNAEIDGNMKSISDDVTTREISANKNVASGYAGLSATRALQLINTAGTFTSVLQNAASVARTWTLKDGDGTVAFMTDITGGTSAGSFTTLTAGWVTAVGLGLNTAPTSAGTVQTWILARNTGGDFFVGKEGSVAGAYFTGSAAYDDVIYSTTATNIIVGGAKRGVFSAAGLAVTGLVSATAGSIVTGSALLAATNTGNLSFESPNTRFYVGDGTGYSFRFSKRVASVTTDLVTITDSGSLTVTGQISAGGAVAVGNGAGVSALTLNSIGSNVSDLIFQSAGVARWIFEKAGTESGSNVGGDLSLYRYTDAGAYLGNPLTINRATGLITANNGLTVTNTITGSISGNAGTVGGLPIHAGVNSEANKVVRTDASGYLLTGYINSAAGNEGNATSPPRVWGTNGTDAYLRTYLTANLSVAYASTAGSAGAVSISYSSAANSTYQMLWGSGTAVYGGSLITCNPSTGQLNVGSLVATGNVTAYSDERLKTNWRDLPSNFINELSLVKSGIYDRLDQDMTQVGVSAQSLQQLMPNAVLEDATGMLSVSYGPAALAACIELAKEIQALKSEIQTLKGL